MKEQISQVAIGHSIGVLELKGLNKGKHPKQARKCCEMSCYSVWSESELHGCAHQHNFHLWNKHKDTQKGRNRLINNLKPLELSELVANFHDKKSK